MSRSAYAKATADTAADDFTKTRHCERIIDAEAIHNHYYWIALRTLATASAVATGEGWMTILQIIHSIKK